MVRDIYANLDASTPIPYDDVGGVFIQYLTSVTGAVATVNTGSGLDAGQAAQLTAAVAASARAEALLEADEKIRADRYQKLTPGTNTVILDKDVAVSGDNIDLTEHS